MIVLMLMVFLAGSTAAPSEAPAVDGGRGCAEWNTEGFFIKASVEEIATCLDAGADPNAFDQHGRPILHLASKFAPSADVIAALVRAGADPNAEDSRGWTPLEVAVAFNSNAAVISVLVDAGATPTALVCARKNPGGAIPRAPGTAPAADPD